MESPMIAPSEPTRITVHRASRPSLASTPPKKTTTSPGKMNPANTDASAAGSRKIRANASHGGKPSTCSMSQLTIDTTKALRRLNPSNDGVPAAGASPGAARDAGPGATALGRLGAGRGGLPGQPELAAGWGTGQSAVRRHRRWRRPGPAGSTAARPRLDGPSSPLPGQPCPQLLDLGAVLRLGGRLLDPLGQLSALRAAGELGEFLGQ